MSMEGYTGGEYGGKKWGDRVPEGEHPLCCECRACTSSREAQSTLGEERVKYVSD